MVHSKLFLATNYYQLAIELTHTYRAAFHSWWGIYEYVVLSFGLCRKDLIGFGSIIWF